MSSWAEIDENNIVLRVIACDNNDPEEGYEWIVKNLGGNWLKTSYNTRRGVHYLPDSDTPSGQPALRKNYAGIGFTYDSIRDAFIPPKPYPSWVLNEETCCWDAPVVYPSDGKHYYWVEELENWVVIPEEA